MSNHFLQSMNLIFHYLQMDLTEIREEFKEPQKEKGEKEKKGTKKEEEEKEKEEKEKEEKEKKEKEKEKKEKEEKEKEEKEKEEKEKKGKKSNFDVLVQVLENLAKYFLRCAQWIVSLGKLGEVSCDQERLAQDGSLSEASTLFLQFANIQSRKSFAESRIYYAQYGFDLMSLSQELKKKEIIATSKEMSELREDILGRLAHICTVFFESRLLASEMSAQLAEDYIALLCKLEQQLVEKDEKMNVVLTESMKTQRNIYLSERQSRPSNRIYSRGLRETKDALMRKCNILSDLILHNRDIHRNAKFWKSQFERFSFQQNGHFYVVTDCDFLPYLFRFIDQVLMRIQCANATLDL